MQKIDVMIGRMRLLLADVSTREEQLNQDIHQSENQTKKLLNFTLYGESPLDMSLTMLGEVEDRLELSLKQLKHLKMIRARLESEIESLQLTKRVEQLKVELALLTNQKDQSLRDGTEAQRILDLQAEINEVSERAARTIGLGRAL
jgi:hypothetical protein